MLKHFFASDVFSSILSFFLKGESVPFLAHVLLVMAPRVYFIEKTKFFCLRQDLIVAASHNGAALTGCVDSALAPSVSARLWAGLHPRAVQNPLRKNPANRPPVASVFPC